MPQTDRLLLRHWEDSDAEVLYRLARSPDIGPAAGWPVHTSVQNSREIIHTALSGEQTYALVLKETGLPVGSIGMFPSDAKFAANRAPELGFWIGRDYWGRGLIPEAVAWMLERCFTAFGAESVWCSHFAGNANSRRVQEKCGFLFHHMEYDATWLAASGERILHYNRITRKQFYTFRTDMGKTPCRVLVTGFAPFSGETVNPSYEAVRALPQRVCGAELITRELPVAFGAAGEALKAALEEVEPEIVLCVGQAGGATGLTLERVAINLRDASIADNCGNQPTGEAVVPGGPAACFTKLPVKAIAASLREQHIPAKLSLSAGSYVCNDVFYTLLHEIETGRPHLRGGFIHVPYAAEQAAQKDAPVPSMELPTITRGLACAIGQTLQMIYGYEAETN